MRLADHLAACGKRSPIQPSDDPGATTGGSIRTSSTRAPGLFRRTMESGYTCSIMAEKDIDHVLAIEQSLFRHPWSKDFFRLILSDVNNYMITLKKKDALIGYGGYHFLKGKTDFLPIKKTPKHMIHLINLAIQPGSQGRGFGTCLLNTLFNSARSRGAEYCYLEMRPSNKCAFSFYRKSGFSIIGVIENYYPQEKEDAFVLGTDITHVKTV